MKGWRFWRPLVVLLAASLGILGLSVWLLYWFTAPDTVLGDGVLRLLDLVPAVQLAWPLCRLLFLGYLYLLAVKALRVYLSDHRGGERPARPEEEPPRS